MSTRRRDHDSSAGRVQSLPGMRTAHDDAKARKNIGASTRQSSCWNTSDQADSQAKVRYFTQGKERIFPRSPQVIGRAVQNCHPPHSVHVVNRILESFRKGEKDEAEFWIEMRGRFLHIRYFAVRDAQKHYKGCLEVTQDVTKIRKLEGQRRLLDWS